jgi:hypothetical protein
MILLGEIKFKMFISRMISIGVNSLLCRESSKTAINILLNDFITKLKKVFNVILQSKAYKIKERMSKKNKNSFFYKIEVLFYNNL